MRLHFICFCDGWAGQGSQLQPSHQQSSTPKEKTCANTQMESLLQVLWQELRRLSAQSHTLQAGLAPRSVILNTRNQVVV
jgi:hypothetical protein